MAVEIEGLRAAAELRAWLDSGGIVHPARYTYDLLYLVDLVESIPPDRLNPWHTITIKQSGWHMAHPVTCDLSACPFDEIAAAWERKPTEPDGRYRWHQPDDDPSDWEWVG